MKMMIDEAIIEALQRKHEQRRRSDDRLKENENVKSLGLKRSKNVTIDTTPRRYCRALKNLADGLVTDLQSADARR